MPPTPGPDPTAAGRQRPRFVSTRFRAGYDRKEVDAFLGEADAEITRLSAERDRLHEVLNAHQSRRARADPAAEGTPQAGAAQAGGNACIEMLTAAEHLHDEAVSAAYRTRDKMLNEARQQADRLLEDVESRRKATMKELTQQRRRLERDIKMLHEFEREHATRLAALMEAQLDELDDQ